MVFGLGDGKIGKIRHMGFNGLILKNVGGSFWIWRDIF